MRNKTAIIYVNDKAIEFSDLMVGGLTLIERHVLALYYHGIREILITAPKSEWSKFQIRRSFEDLNLIYTEKPESFSDSYFIRGDTVFHKGFIADLDAFLDGTEYTDAVMTGKALNGSTWFSHSDGFSLDGFLNLYIGISWFSAESLEKIFNSHDEERDPDIGFLEDNFSNPLLGTAIGKELFFRKIDSVTDAKTAETLLFHSLRKPQDGIISRLFNRTLSLPVSRILVKTSLTPNQLSVINAGFAIISGFMLFFGNNLLGLSFYISGFLGGLFMQMCSIYDGCDGEVARVKFQYTHTGDWLDTIIDDITNSIFFAGVAAWSWFSTGQERFIYMGVAAFVGQWIANYSMYYYLIKIAGTGNNQDYKVTTGKSKLFDMFLNNIKYLTKRDFHLFAFFVMGIAGRLDIGAYIICAFAVGAGLILGIQHIILLITGVKKA
ncbi:MAG: CDP-alcohol phosphatidyltransferase family protein [Deltaproteobacteria bacterium]|nr:CDP-alcohol phosphatidyltransferase family protein [Deltaproteobacteria bacterium]